MKKNNPKLKNNKSGFTLIELIFATVLISMMFTIMITTFIGVLRFYTWSNVTRKNQESTRQLTDVMTRLINSKKIGEVGADGSSICLLPANTGSSDLPVKIYLDNYQVKLQKYDIPTPPEGETLQPSDYCQDGQIKTSELVLLSDPQMKIASLQFKIVLGSNLPLLKHKLSTTIKIKSINGQSNSCAEGDNFCDQTEYTTAAKEN